MAPKASRKVVLKRPASAAVPARKRPASDAALAPVAAAASAHIVEEALPAEPSPARAYLRPRPVTKHDPKAKGKWDDPTLHQWTQVIVADVEVRSQLQQQLLLSRQDRLGRLGRNHGVNWDTLSLLPQGGFAIQLETPSTFRTAHQWWRHRFMQVCSAPVGQYYVMTGLPNAPTDAVPMQMEATASAWLHGARGSVVARPTASALDFPPGPPAPVAAAVVAVQWPRYPARRLAGGQTREAGLGGNSAAYSGGELLGEGTFGVVHKVSFGGHNLAVKAFSRENAALAWQEASAAEHVRGHPNVVQLLDACLRQSDGCSLLVYRFHGMSLRDALFEHPPGASSIRSIVGQAAKGLAHLHSHWLYHSDLKPENILCDGLVHGLPRVVLADLGGTVEVGLGQSVFAAPRTTLWYRSPELLRRQSTASGIVWLKADVWALGIVMCEIVELDFFIVEPRGRPESTLCPLMYYALGAVFPGFDDVLEEPVLTLPWPLRELHGPAFMDCLEQFLTWNVRDRPDIRTCLRQPWMGTDTLQYRHEPSALIAGDRHDWAYISGVMSQEVLTWLQQDVHRLDDLREASQVEEEDGLKTILSGKLIDQPGSQSLNGLVIKEPLPCAHLAAWLRAWKSHNAGSLAQLAIAGTQAVRLLSRGGRGGKNAEHFLQTPATSWCLVAGQLHIFDKPGDLHEPQHHDGGASILHMGVTLYGRRRVRCFTAGPDGEHEDFPQMPGSVYVGTLTGCLHQVLHDEPRASCEARAGHSVSLMVRTTLFPHNRARNGGPFSDPELVKCLAHAFSEALRDQVWVLPTLRQCQQALAPALPEAQP